MNYAKRIINKKNNLPWQTIQLLSTILRFLLPSQRQRNGSDSSTKAAYRLLNRRRARHVAYPPTGIYCDLRSAVLNWRINSFRSGPEMLTVVSWRLIYPFPWRNDSPAGWITSGAWQLQWLVKMWTFLSYDHWNNKPAYSQKWFAMSKATWL